MIDEAGDAHFIRADNVQFVGTLAVNGNGVSGNYEGFTQFGTAFADGSTHGTGSLSGTVAQRQSLSVNTQFTTDANSKTNETLSLTFNALYDNASSLSTIAGNYTDQASGDVVSVSGSGQVNWQDPQTGCIGNGSVSIINASYNAYRVQFSYGNCLGATAVLNGVSFTGLATLDTTATPTRAIVGVTGSGGGAHYALVFALNRS